MKSGSSFSIHRKGGILALRMMLVLATTLLILPPDLKTSVPILGFVMIGVFLLSNLALMAVREELLLERRADFLFVLSDSILVGLGLFYANNGRPELPVAFFVILLLAAMGRDLPRIVASATLVAGFYIFLTHRSGMHEGIPMMQSFLRVPFLYITGLYYGAAIMRVRSNQERVQQMETRRMDLEAFMEVTRATTSSLELSKVLQAVVQRVVRMVDALRCSIILMKESGSDCLVMASNDDPEREPYPVDPEKYPELQRAIRTRKEVIIDDPSREQAEDDPRSSLRDPNFRSILVVPILFQEEIMGLLFVGTARDQKGFAPHEIKACQVVANASANAIKNAILFEQMREESKRRKETSEILQNIMEHFPDLIFLADLEGKITEFNTGGEALLGIERDQIIGKPASSLFAGGLVPLTEEVLKAKGGSVPNCQVLLKSSDDELRHGIATLALLRDETGEATGIIGICKDITGLKQAQQHLQNAKNHSTIQRISKMVLELNTPLSGVLISARQMMGTNHDPEKVRNSKKIFDSATQCREIVQKLLKFSSQHSGDDEELDLGNLSN